MDPQSLRAELEQDPESLGYASLLAEGQDSEVADLLNAPREGVRVRRGTVSRDELLSDFTAGLLRIPTLADAAKRGRWVYILDYVVKPRTSFNLASPTVDQLMGMAQADGLFSAEETEAILYQPGSRAEQLWGVGAVVTADQVSEAWSDQRSASGRDEGAAEPGESA